MLAPDKPAAPRGQLRKTSVSQQIYDALRIRVLSLELVPGENLSRAEIAGFYGVSQTPVRDAMLKLEEEGLLVIFPQSKTEVSRIDVNHARETQFLRMSVEIEVAKQLATYGAPGATDTARAILRRQKSAQEAHDLTYFEELDRAFHGALLESAGLESLWTLISERSGQIDRLRKLNLPVAGKAVEVIDAHCAILDAIQNRDAGEAEKHVRIHLSGTLVQVNQIIARNPEFF
ncbi:MAG: GntR family transcriptional regulator [Rhodobacteraceae bacterium]|nr:GntR family transcriptional regulator [Paracoccaceae bacterium]MBL4813383.1 GntR family transcriptional regulator [Paracoccaceae bacterium]